MAKNPLTVGGMGRIIHKLAEDVTPEKKEVDALPPGAEYASEGEVEANGNFGFNKHGEFGFLGNVVVRTPTSVEVFEIGEGEAKLDATMGREVDSNGLGTLKMRFRTSVKLVKPGRATA